MYGIAYAFGVCVICVSVSMCVLIVYVFVSTVSHEHCVAVVACRRVLVRQYARFHAMAVWRHCGDSPRPRKCKQFMSRSYPKSIPNSLEAILQLRTPNPLNP